MQLSSTAHSKLTLYSSVNESSVIAVQIFDQRKFKRRDQGFLGVVNIRVGDVVDLELGGHGKDSLPRIREFIAKDAHRNADAGPQKVQ